MTLVPAEDADTAAVLVVVLEPREADQMTLQTCAPQQNCRRRSRY